MSTERAEPTPLPLPSRHQLALTICLAVLPTLTVLNVALSSVPADVPTMPRTFGLATIADPIVMYGLMPRLHRLRAQLLVRRAS